MKSKLGFALLLIISILVLPTFLTSNKLVSAATQGDEQKTIAELLQDYEDALQYELEYGDTQEIDDTETDVKKILVGESQEKMDQLWAETLEKINALQYRPAEERSGAIAVINQVTNADVEFTDHSRTPYNPSAEIEVYESGDYIFQVDVASEEIIKMWIKDQRNFSVDAKYSKDVLVKLAQEHVNILSPKVNLETLILSTQDKTNEVYFFRWEDPTRKTTDGMTAFIQVAISRAGDLLNYENTLPISIKQQGTILDSIFSIPSVVAIGANEYYSNGGSSWGWEFSTSY
ncbi:MAG: hypothetical protein SVR94_17255 [Pseudomonadota bacterium]|nr:hypothetical protein [Pseudomonadota bacterium]